MIEIDGSHGEGGGQVLRTSLALSIVTGKPFRLFNIRAGRTNPGLRNQHLACVNAAAEISAARVQGASLDSAVLEFTPEGVWPGNYYFRINTAASAGLVLQTVLPALLHADGASSVRITGGTHNAWAPPAEFLQQAFLPLLSGMGAECSLNLEIHGFYPVGGGLYQLNVSPWQSGRPLELRKRKRADLRAEVLLSRLPEHVGERELEIVREHLRLHPNQTSVRHVQSPGPGNALIVTADCGEHSEVFSAFGKRGKPAEKVAREACDEAERWLKADVPVGEQLADQLLLPMALGAGGRFRTVEPSGHTRTNIETIQRFLDVEITCEELEGAWEVKVSL